MYLSTRELLVTALFSSLLRLESVSAFVAKTSSIASNQESRFLNQHRPNIRLNAQEFDGELEVSRTYGEDSTTTTHDVRYHIHNRMNLSSQQAAPILVLHGGPGIPSDYLLPLRDAVPYRSIVFYDQLGCGRSPGPDTSEAYSIESSLDDLELVIKKAGLSRFHLYGQSFGGILTFEYMKRVAERGSEQDDSSAPKCLSAILSSTPCDVAQVEAAAGDLIASILKEDPDESTVMDRFQAKHVCQKITNGEKPQPLVDAYDKAGTPGVWRGTESIQGWTATKPSEDAVRMPSCMVMRGEHDFVTPECVEGWKGAFNHNFVRIKEIPELAHHGLLEDGKKYGEIVDSYFAEYD